MQRPSSARDERHLEHRTHTRGSETAGLRKAGGRGQHASWVMSNQRPECIKEQVHTAALGPAGWRGVQWGTLSQLV